MHACRFATASILLGMAVATPFAAKSASFRVGITIVDACEVRTSAYTLASTRDAMQADCSADTPYSVTLGDRSMQSGDLRSSPAIDPEDGIVLVSPDQKYRIATFTF